MSGLRKPKHLSFLSSLGKVADKGLSFLGKGIQLGKRGISKAEHIYHDLVQGIRRNPDLAPGLKLLEHNPAARAFIAGKDTIKDLLEDAKVGVDWGRAQLHPSSTAGKSFFANRLPAPPPAAAFMQN